MPLHIPVDIQNTGIARWLGTNILDIGVVKLGAHLYDENHILLDLDFWRNPLGKMVFPGETLTHVAEIVFPSPGTYYVAIDLVSEHVCWFENAGSTPIHVQVTVN
jgi:hypothetical protein